MCVCRPRVLGNNTIYADGGDREADKDRCRIFFLFLFLSGTRFHRVPWSKSPLTRPLFMSPSSLGLPPPHSPSTAGSFQSTAGARLPRFLLVVPSVPFTTRRPSSTIARTRRPPREQCSRRGGEGGIFREERRRRAVGFAAVSVPSAHNTYYHARVYHTYVCTASTRHHHIRFPRLGLNRAPSR